MSARDRQNFWRKPTPPQLNRRPKDRRGLPVPFANYVDAAGVVDFTLVDPRRAIECAVARTCGLCGERLTYWIAFLGGPQSAATRSYVDPPMHEDCALAALRLCPHIAHRAALAWSAWRDCLTALAAIHEASDTASPPPSVCAVSDRAADTERVSDMQPRCRPPTQPASEPRSIVRPGVR